MKLNRVGEKYLTKEGYEIKIIEYFNSSNCTIEFDNGVVFKNIQHYNIKNGAIKNPYHPSVLGRGYFGIGNYGSKTHNKIYYTWNAMLSRCYSERYQEKYPTYKDVTVYEEWYNFQNFAKWFEENYKEDFQLDKDILQKGNKIYSPETCCFVPQEINILLTKSKGTIDNLPMGISKHGNKFQAQITMNGNLVYLGAFDTIEEAFIVYKTAKEEYIKEIASRYKNQITRHVYQALINYEIEK